MTRHVRGMVALAARSTHDGPNAEQPGGGGFVLHVSMYPPIATVLRRRAREVFARIFALVWRWLYTMQSSHGDAPGECHRERAACSRTLRGHC